MTDQPQSDQWARKCTICGHVDTRTVYAEQRDAERSRHMEPGDLVKEPTCPDCGEREFEAVELLSQRHGHPG